MNQSIHRLPHLLLVVLTALALGASSQVHALELNRAFSNDMVLQRDKAVKVWGTAKKGETVTVTFAGQTARATADRDGRWVATLKPMKANASAQVLGVKSSGARIALKNVVVGDVFLFARQSAIEVSLGSTPKGKKAAASVAANKNYRFIRIKASPASNPVGNLKKDATRGWQVVDKKSALAMSAAAFYLGRDLAKDVKVPLGIVDLDMGYHFASAWLSDKGVKQVMSGEGVGAADVKAEMALRDKDITSWDAGLVESRRGRWSKPKGSQTPKLGLSPIEMPYFPSACYNTVIHPLRGLVVKGLLLQLGNDYPFLAFTRLRNMGKDGDLARLHKANANSYRINKTGNRMTPSTLPLVIDDLRNSLGDASLPLAWIMPPGSDVYQYGTHNREVRELQRRTQLKSKDVTLVLPGAEHVPMSGQPADEALLAKRCKQWVLGTFYGAKGPTSGPLFDRVELKNNTATIFFKNGTAEGLIAKGDALKHFEAAGGDREFFPCKAEIDGSTIKLTTDMGVNPMYVRFGWSRKPVQGLVNSAGLPAVPFTTNSEWEYNWWPEPAPIELPEEYSMPASKWPKRNYAIINYDTEKKGMHLGPTGLWGAPSGPNLYIDKITPGSPADGKVFVGDMLYGVNGKEFGSGPDDKYKQFAAGVTKAEAEAGGGRMILNIRRKGKLIEAPIKLEYMGSYSATSPWNCDKSKRIVEKAEEYMRKGLRPRTGVPNDDNYMYGPWNDNVLFLMASGNPELQGLVRRYIRKKLDQLDALRRGNKKGGYNAFNGWGNDYLMMLFGEYYHRTGDSTVLPDLEYLVRNSQSNHIKMREAGNWPPTGPSGYGTHPAGQMPATMGAVLAQEAGCKVDKYALSYALKHLYYRRAENGYILYYGYGPFLVSSRQVDGPQPIDPERKAAGMLSSMNGKLGTGAALFSIVKGHDKAVKNCSERCVYAFNKTRTGHGGAWFNNYWTPIGAYHAGKEKYQHFMKGQQWWRELYRDHTGAVWQAHNAKGKQSVLAVGFVVHRVVQYKKLRMFGAPRSAFATNPPVYLKPALAAHRKRDYALAEKLIQKVMKEQNIPAKEQPMVRHFLDSVQTVRKSIEYDLAYTEDALKRGEYYLASIELPQLKMVVAPGNARLKKIAAAVESAKGRAAIAAARKKAQNGEKSKRSKKRTNAGKSAQSFEQTLASIVTLVKDGKSYSAGRRKSYQSYPENQWNRWRLKILETPSHTPVGWQKPGYDDSHWDQKTLPTVWPMGHTALMRTTFEVKDTRAFKSLHVRAYVYKQRNLQVYLNGELVAKVNNMPNTQIDFALTPYAITLLKRGTNSLAVSAQHGKRWVDFGFRLEGRRK